MWVPKEVADWFKISKDSVDSLREELSAVRAERDALKTNLATLQNSFDWIRMNWNQMQAENKALLERAYGVRVPVPELLQRQPNNQFNLQDLFNDMGDEEAGRHGLPIYGDKN